MTDSSPVLIRKLLVYLVAIIFCLVPFHAFLTVWLGSSFGHYTAWRLWDETLLAIGLLLVFYLFFQAHLRLTKYGHWLALLTLVYVLLNLIIGLWALKSLKVTLTALADGLILNLRLLVIFWL